MDYKARLITLNLLPLSLWLEVLDITFFTKLCKEPPDNFTLSDYISFIEGITRFSINGKIKSSFAGIPRTNLTRHFYFNRIVRLRNSLPPLDLSLSLSSLKKQVYDFYWNYFIQHYDFLFTCS